MRHYVLSGRDERRLNIPQCPICGRARDIVICYVDSNPAGWIIPDRQKELYGVSVVLSRNFLREKTPVIGYCLTCGPHKHNEISDKALRFFKEQVQLGNYLIWDAFTRVSRT